MDKIRIRKTAWIAMACLIGGIAPVYAEDTTATTTTTTTAPVPAAPGNLAALPTSSTTTTVTQEAPTAAPPVSVATTESTTTESNTTTAAAAPSDAADVTTTTTTSQTTTVEQKPTLPLLPKSMRHFSREERMDNRPVPEVQSAPMTYEQSQEAMIKSLPEKPTSADENAAFNALLQQNMPLTPQQVVRLRQLIDLSQRAASTPATVPPKPVSTTIMMNLAPGTTPPAIRLSKGYVSSLVFVDSTGAPWPIAGYELGDSKLANIQWDGKSNVLLIQANTTYSDANMVIRLAGLMTPLTLELVSGQRVVDFRTDVHVAGIGPSAKDLPTGNGLPMSASPLLLSVLDGIAPAGSKLLTVKGGDCQAWLLGDKMYLRTRLTLLSPGWVGKMVSPDGMLAYEVQKSSSVLVSQYGEPIELKIEGF